MFVGNLNNLQQCMAKQDMMEQEYASDSEEEAKEPEKKGFFGMFGGSKAKKRTAPTTMNIGSSQLKQKSSKVKTNDAYSAEMF